MGKRFQWVPVVVAMSLGLLAASTARAQVGGGGGTLTAVTPGITYMPGDANRNGIIDAADLTSLKLNFGQRNATWSSGDFNADRLVDTVDFNVLARTVYVAQFDPASVEGNVPILTPLSGVPTPEPAAAGLIALVTIASLSIRRRHSIVRI